MINFENSDIFVPLLLELQAELKNPLAVILPEKYFLMEFASTPCFDDPVAHIRNWMIAMNPDASVIIILEK